MTILYKIILLLQLFVIVKCSASVIINKYDDNECVSLINIGVIHKVENYRNVTKLIIDSVKNELGDRMYQNYTDFIDKFGARISGSENLEEAIDYMIQLSTINGMENVFTEEVEVPHWIRGDERAEMLQPQSKTIGILGLGRSVPTPPEGITAEVVVVKSFEELDSLPNKKVTGKIIVFNPTFISYGETVKYRTQGSFRAAQKGAVASLIRSITPFSLYTLHTGSQNYSPNITAIPTASITVEDAKDHAHFWACFVACVKMILILKLIL